MIELDVEVTGRLRIRTAIDARAIAILGPSGSGKSTLLEAIAGLHGGRVVIDGVSIGDLPPERRRVGWVPQEVALFPHLDVARNIAFGARKSIGDAIELLELGPLLTRSIDTLSGGERQRVALARALASDPRVLLLDEPLAAVDVAHRGRIVPFLMRLRSTVPLLLVTHDVGEAAAIASHALVLRDGALRAVGPIGEAIGAALAEVPDLRIDNLLVGTLTDGVFSPRADGATYALSADEIILATERPRAISARNILEGTVRSVEPVGRDALVEVEALGQKLHARLTDRAVEELSLASGQRVVLIIKGHALRRV